MKHALKTLLILSLLLGTMQATMADSAWIKNSIPSERVGAIKTTTWGIVAGENDKRPWLNPFNGIYISEDLGQTWTKAGLAGKAIEDLDFANGKIFAATYYKTSGIGGLYVSANKGVTWDKKGPSFATAKVSAEKNNVVIGGYSHGLWMSTDGGETWTQKIGDGSGWTGPEITCAKIMDKIIIACIYGHTYISKDTGNTWSEINTLSGKTFGSAAIKGSVLYLGTIADEGLYISKDSGATWAKNTGIPSKKVPAIEVFRNSVYASSQNTATGKSTIYRSDDGGSTWHDLGLETSTENIIGIENVFSEPSAIFATLAFGGMYNMTEENYKTPTSPFLDIPWNYTNPTELVDKITAYFDHQYPLLGYAYHSEPEEENKTTLSFTGEKALSPKIFYSSHNGTDFAASFGENVLAPASGYATYYYCDACGHSIKIDHENGYETTFMHLQKTGLITTNQTPVWIDRGQIIGEVGLTGNTTGPHIHLSVKYDKNQNGKFDDYPDGFIDPFGWQSKVVSDPWKNYTWSDVLGKHAGTESRYLWNMTSATTSKYITVQNNILEMEHKKVVFPQQDLANTRYTAFFNNYIRPHIPVEQSNLEYIENSSVNIKLADHYGNSVNKIEWQATITLDSSVLDLTNIVLDTLKIYFWDETNNKWEPLDTLIDPQDQTISAKTDHFSWFALLGEKRYPNKPETLLKTTSIYQDDWHLTYPMVELAANDNNGIGIKNTVYSLDKGLNWEKYTAPFEINTDGFVTLMFKSEDNAGNWEDPNETILKINTKGSWVKKIKVRDNLFETNIL